MTIRAALMALLVTVAPAVAAPTTFRIIFGDRADRTTDFSGTIRLTSGEVLRMTPWRFIEGDAIRGTTGWTLQARLSRLENQPDDPRPMMTAPGGLNVMPVGVTITIDAPSSATARIETAQGDFDVPVSDIRHDRRLTFLEGNAIVQRTPTVERVSEPDPNEQFDYPSVATADDGTTWVAWQGYRDGGDHVYVRHSTASGWSGTERLTSRKSDVFRTALAIDGRQRPWVVWSERSDDEWHLYARRYENGRWQSARKLTTANAPNAFHRLATTGSGDLHLVWTAYDNGVSHVYWSRLDGDDWSSARAISGPSAWNPEAAADSAGNLWVTWDSYRNGNYDIYLRQVDTGGSLGEEIQVTESGLFQTHPTVAVDRDDRVWLAWHESGANWGKDWTHEDDRRATVLYTDRTPQVAILDNGEWKQPATDLISSIPWRYLRYVQYPRILAGDDGRIWCGLQLRTKTSSNRGDFWAYDGRWEFYLTTLEDDKWTTAMPIPESSLRPEGPLLLEAASGGVRLVWTDDNRPIFAPSFYGLIENNHEIYTATFDVSGTPSPRFEGFAERQVRTPPVHPDEKAEVARIRGYRTSPGPQELRILRGDFHRHTEISSDGSGDGSIEDYFRYMIDAAAMDTGIVGDHNAGNDDEYCWWRTEKAADLFLVPGRYTPMFGYERSPSYPNGHRNMVFAQRGVKTLPIPRDEQRGNARTGPILYPYLKKNNGIAMVHSSATSQGTDWGDNDPEVEPLVELYQGYHASYEYPGAPRAESDKLQVSVHGSYRPEGFWWKALEKGLKIGVQGSSDHISTHTSYTMIYTPSAGRDDILKSMRSRHAYAATDNIIIDFQVETADGRNFMMGDAFASDAAPNLRFKILGTDEITAVDIVKDQTFVYHSEPNDETVEFTYRDTSPAKKESYYYIRIQQRDRNLAWSSPVWVDYR